MLDKCKKILKNIQHVLRIINSSSWKLFAKSPDSFLHEGLKYEFKDSCYLFQANKSDDGYDLIHSLFVANLPETWSQTDYVPLGDVETTWVKSLLKCVSEDEMFKCYCNKLLTDFTLIPADNSIMYSMKSDLLPMIIERCHSKLETLLRKLQIPFIDSSMFGSAFSEIGIKLPTTAISYDILRCIYLVSDECYDKLMALNNDELTSLFTVFESIILFGLLNKPVF